MLGNFLGEKEGRSETGNRLMPNTPLETRKRNSGSPTSFFVFS